MFVNTPTIKKTVIAGGVLLLIFGAISWWVRSAEQDARNLAIAEERERQVTALLEENKQTQLAMKVEREENARLISNLIEQQAKLANSVATRNQAANRVITEVRAPKTTEQVVKDSQEHLGLTPQVQGNLFQLTPDQFRDLIAVKVDRDRLAANLEDTKQQLQMEEEKVARLGADLDRAVRSLEQANKLIGEYQVAMESYKKSAKKSGWRKAAAIGQRIGEVAATGLIVAALTR